MKLIRSLARLLLALAMIIAVLAVGSPPASAAPVVDQQAVPVNPASCQAFYALGSDTLALAQTFTASMTGDLTRVDIAVNHNFGTAPLTVEIRAVTPGGLPGNTFLAQTTVPFNDPTMPIAPGGFLTVTFPDPAQVTASTQYAIVVYTDSSAGYSEYEWCRTKHPLRHRRALLLL